MNGNITFKLADKVVNFQSGRFIVLLRFVELLTHSSINCTMKPIATNHYNSWQTDPHLLECSDVDFQRCYFFNKWLLPGVPLEVTHALLPALSVLLRHSRLLLLTDLNVHQGISDTSCFLELKIKYSSDHNDPHTS